MSETPLSPDDTIAEAAAWVKARAEEGCQCPACGRFYKVYSRPLYIQQALWLIELLLRYERTQEWVHVSTLRSQGGDYAKLKHWDLIEQEPENDDETKTSAGLWKPRPNAWRLVKHGHRVISHVALGPGDDLLGFEGYYLTIGEVLGNHFDIRAIIETGAVPLFDKKVHKRRMERGQPGWRQRFNDVSLAVVRAAEKGPGEP